MAESRDNLWLRGQHNQGFAATNCLLPLGLTAAALLLSLISAAPAFADMPPPSFYTPFDPVSLVFISVFAASSIVLWSTWSGSKKAGSWTIAAKVRGIAAGVVSALTGLVLAAATIHLIQNAPMSFEERQAYIKQREDRLAAERNKAPIIYCMRDLAKGAKVQPEYLEVREIRSDRVPSGAVPTVESAVGRTTAVDIAQGTVLLDAHFEAVEPIEPVAQQAAPPAKSNAPAAIGDRTAALPKGAAKAK